MRWEGVTLAVVALDGRWGWEQRRRMTIPFAVWNQILSIFDSLARYHSAETYTFTCTCTRSSCIHPDITGHPTRTRSRLYRREKRRKHHTGVWGGKMYTITTSAHSHESLDHDCDTSVRPRRRRFTVHSHPSTQPADQYGRTQQ
ncbi:hypothetical protein FIBSPDRAFT_488383 [Athelia psychrophila]|uniref:Uncharacterized protein n=1 Tax=Athelia psychrophila TaxID=1759441 RepID=A0A166KRT1_9AGAM|nr:hypothetical protein FIBSPDRAFT_488383 [Fibularhizoctonia sp. CBS 109695]